MIPQEQRAALYPTWEQLKKSGIEVNGTPELKRLRDNWILTPDWKDIFVKEDSSLRPPVRPYYDKKTNTLHEIASIAISEPKVSSVIVTAGDFDEGFSKLFQEYHEEHIGTDGWDDPREMDPNISQVELPSYYDPDSENREPLYFFKILKCCGEPRPEDMKITTTVTAAPDGLGYVTVHDYILAVHPWMLGLEVRVVPIWKSLRLSRSNYGPIQMDDLSINCSMVSKCFIDRRRVLSTRIHNGLGYGQKDSDKVWQDQQRRLQDHAARNLRP